MEFPSFYYTKYFSQRVTPVVSRVVKKKKVARRVNVGFIPPLHHCGTKAMKVELKYHF